MGAVEHERAVDGGGRRGVKGYCGVVRFVRSHQVIRVVVVSEIGGREGLLDSAVWST